MEIKGKVHCLFEQSGTFKNQFKELGYEAYDYDIQNEFNETDYVIDLFEEITNAYDNKPSIFDVMNQDDLLMAFFPCIYFTGSGNPLFFNMTTLNYKNLSLREKFDNVLERSKNRQYFYELINKMVYVCLERNLRLIIENPWNSDHYLHNNFIKNPDLIDNNRKLRGDEFKKPTGYWFFNCEHTTGYSFNINHSNKNIRNCKGSNRGGVCSTERSMITSTYARNFICDFIIGKQQPHSITLLF